jgi:hypothetical protein
MPIITVNAEAGYDVSYTEGSGFLYAIYSADGRFPQYSNDKPFEIKVTQNVNGFDEDISLLENEYAVKYNWSVLGKTYQEDSINLKETKLYTKEPLKNQK